MKTITLKPYELADNEFTGFARINEVHATDLKCYEYLLIKEKPESWADGYDAVSGLNTVTLREKFADLFDYPKGYFYVQIFSIQYFGGYYFAKCEKDIEIIIRRDLSVITCDITALPNKTVVRIAKCLGEIQMDLDKLNS